MKEFTGQIAAIIHREDDAEDKWVVTPSGLDISGNEILDQTRFQERYFHSVLRKTITGSEMGS